MNEGSQDLYGTIKGNRASEYQSRVSEIYVGRHDGLAHGWNKCLDCEIGGGIGGPYFQSSRVQGAYAELAGRCVFNMTESS